MKKKRITTVGYTASEDEVLLVSTKAKRAGLSRSEFLRRLVEIAEIVPPQIALVGTLSKTADKELTK